MISSPILNDIGSNVDTDKDAEQLPVSRLKLLLHRVKKQLAVRAALPLDFAFGSRYQQSAGILMYHRISSYTAGPNAATCNVTAARFRSQLAGLLAKGYRAISLRQLIAGSQEFSFPEKSFVVTFDDGYENLYTEAWPILQELKIPITLFMVTDYLDSQQPFAFDDWSLAGREPVEVSSWRPLSTAQCREMLQHELFDIGCHTHTHCDFRGNLSGFAQDLQTAYYTLDEKFGLTEAPFSFPWGCVKDGFATPQMIEVAKNCGATTTLTTESELVLPGSSAFAWGRFTAESVDSAASLASKLNGWYSVIRNSCNRMLNSVR